jgi:hypothetical protein
MFSFLPKISCCASLSSTALAQSSHVVALLIQRRYSTRARLSRVFLHANFPLAHVQTSRPSATSRGAASAPTVPTGVDDYTTPTPLPAAAARAGLVEASRHKKKKKKKKKKGGGWENNKWKGGNNKPGGGDWSYVPTKLDRDGDQDMDLYEFLTVADSGKVYVSRVRVLATALFFFN